MNNKTKKCKKICKNNLFNIECLYDDKLIDCDSYNYIYKDFLKINKLLKNLFKNEFNPYLYSYKPITKQLSGGISGSIIFNIFNKNGTINKKYIGKTLINRFFHGNNTNFITDDDFIFNYINYLKKNENSYLVKIFYIGIFKINGNYYDSIIMENNDTIRSINKTIIDCKTTNVPFQTINSIKNIQKLVSKKKIKLDKNILLSDLNFLKSNNRIDYSSFLVIGNNNFKYSIIDILQPFNNLKLFVKTYKNLFSLDKSIVTTDPDDYKNKFYKLIDNFGLI